MQRNLALALTVGAVIWSALLLAAPHALRSDSVVIANAAAVLYDGAAVVCHQRPERSFSIAGVQLPVCARCSGLYFSAAFGALAAWAIGAWSLSARSARLLFAAAALPTALTVGLEVAGLAYPSNLARALSAIPLGFAGAAVFVLMLRSEASRA